MAYTFGFLGTGHMGSALAEAACACAGTSEVIIANRTPEKAQRLAERLGCTAADNEMVINSAAYLFLGAKPQDMFTLLDAIAPLLAARKTPFVLVSMAAGITLQELADHTSPTYPILRIMPNTPVAIGEGMTYYTPNANVTQAQLDAFLSGIAGCGQFDRLSEPLLDAGSAVSGCGGAFCNLFTEALADGGVACGLSRAQAYRYAAQMLIGMSKLMLESGKHPAVLKDEACSPAGATIEGVRVLEKAGLRAAVIEAVVASCRKNAILGHET